MTVTAPPRTRAGPARRVLYCADVSGVSGAHRHRQAVETLLPAMGWTVDRADGVLAPLRRGGRGGERSRGRVLAPLVLLANSAVACVLLLAGGLRRGRPDTILWRPGLFQFHGLVLSTLWRVPLVLEVNAPLVDEARRFRDYAWLGLAAWVERRTIASADRIVTVSRQNAERIGRPEVTTVVPNGGGYVAEDEASMSGGCPLCAEPRKVNYAVVLESFRDWHGDAERDVAVEALPDGWTTVAIGDGPNRAAFLERMRERGHEVIALGHIDSASVQHVLAEHASLGFVLYPALDDFWFSPLKLYDFLAHGVPVVATDIGQVGEVGRTTPSMTLVPPGDLAAIADAVRDATRAPRSAPRAASSVLGSRFGWPAAISAYAEALDAGSASTATDRARRR